MSGSRVQYCEVFACKNTTETSKGPFFGFPKDPVRLQKWIDNLGHLKSSRKNKFICADHFKMEAFVDTLKQRLHMTAIPEVVRNNTEEQKPKRGHPRLENTCIRAKLAANWKRDTSEENNESVEPFTNETRRDNATNETTPLPNECQSSNENAKKRKVTGFEAELLDLIKKRKSQITNDETDDDKAFLMSLLPTLKKFDDDQKLTVRIEIMNAIRRVQFNQQPALSSPRSPPRPVIIRAPSASPPLEFPLYAIKTSPKSPPSQDEYGSEYDRSSMQGAIVPSTSNYLQGSYGTNSPSLSDTTDRVSIKDEDTSVSNYDY